MSAKIISPVLKTVKESAPSATHKYPKAGKGGKMKTRETKKTGNECS
jgi:hypothetical protein